MSNEKQNRLCFLIPSYKRCGSVKTISYLRECGVPASDIIVSTQTTSDYEAYTKEYGYQAKIVYRDAHNVAGNRNTCLIEAQQRGYDCAIMLDDDVSSIHKCVSKKQAVKICGKDSFRRLCNQLMVSAKFVGASIVGGMPTSNVFFSSPGCLSLNNIIIGTILYIEDMNIRFDERYAIKEDFELCLRLISNSKLTLRFDDLFCKASHKTKGGCADSWGKDKIYTDMLLAQYPNLISRCNSAAKIQLTKKTQKIHGLLSIPKVEQ